MSWNYRLIRELEPNGDVTFAVHTVFYRDTEDGTLGEPYFCSKDPAWVCEDTIEDVEWALTRFKEALDYPTLDYSDFKKPSLTELTRLTEEFDGYNKELEEKC